MKTETLRSLLMDKELGELTPEVAELLDAYLAVAPEVHSEADIVVRTVHTARETIRHFPQLITSPTVTATPYSEVIRHWFAPSLAYAAALIAVAGIAAWLGFHAGISRPDQNRITVATRAPDPQFENLWTQYHVVYDSGRATFIVAKQP